MFVRVCLSYAAAAALFAPAAMAQEIWTSTGGPDGSRLVDMSSSGQTVLAGSPGGVFLSQDAGRNWVRSDSGLGLLPFVTAVELIGSHAIIGTREGVIFAADDPGGTWQEVSSPVPDAAVERFLADGDRLYMILREVDLGVGGTLWMSTDQGTSWDQIETGMPIGDVYASGQTIFVWGLDPESSFLAVLRRSTDGGQTFETLGGLGGQNGLPAFSTYLRPIISVEDALFVGSDQGVYSSTDGGDNWLITQPPAAHGMGVAELVSDGTRVFLAGSRRQGGGSQEVGPGVWSTDDLGQTWVRADDGLPVSTLRTTHRMLLTDDGLLLSGKHISVYRLDSGLQTWARSDAGMDSSLVRALAASSTAVFANVANSDEVWRYDGGGWAFQSLGVSSPQRQARVLSLATEGAFVFAGMQVDGIYRSEDDGLTWNAANSGVPQYNGTGGLQYREIEAFAASGGFVFAGTGIGIEFFDQGFNTSGGGALRSADGGNSWTRINSGLPIVERNDFGDPIYDPIGCMGIVGGVVLAGHSRIGIYRTTDNGVMWAEANVGLPQTSSGVFPSFTSMATLQDVLYASADGPGSTSGVYKSTDGGLAWSWTSAGLPDRGLNSVAAIGDAIYATFGRQGIPSLKGYGVYRSLDEGQTWNQVGQALESVSVGDAVGFAGHVYAGTHSMGVWELSSNCVVDFNGDGIVNTLDLVAFLNAFNANDPAADFNGDGQINTLDFLAFLDAYSEGCP